MRVICGLLIIFANLLGQDQAQIDIGPDLDLGSLFDSLKSFLKRMTQQTAKINNKNMQQSRRFLLNAWMFTDLTLCMLGFFHTIFSSLLFITIFFKNCPNKFLNSNDPDQADKVSGLIWNNNVCKSYQQKTLFEEGVVFGKA